MKIALLALLPVLLYGDGGQVILQRQTDGRTFTVFADPTPLRAGRPTDFSVLVQDAKTREALLDGAVQLSFGTDGSANATHANASNKLLFAATLTVPHQGNLTLTVHYGAATVSGPVQVLAEEPGIANYWAYFALVPAAILLFALNRRLARVRQVRRPHF